MQALLNAGYAARLRSAATSYPSSLVPVGAPGTPGQPSSISPALLVLLLVQMAAITAVPTALHTVPRARAVSRAAAVPSRSFAAQLRPQQRREARAVRVFAEQSTKAGEPSGRVLDALGCGLGVLWSMVRRPIGPAGRQQPAGTTGADAYRLAPRVPHIDRPLLSLLIGRCWRRDRLHLGGSGA